MTPARELPTIAGYSELVQIGAGGFASVYRARQVRFDRDVAIKVLDVAGLDDRTNARFLRECELMGRLSNHPGIVTIYDAGITEAGLPYIVMQYLEGGSLADRLRSHGPLAPADVVASIGQVADALDTAHAEGILHRDLKPENLLVSQWGHVCLADFGIATFAERHGTITSNALTPAHAPPEILEGAVPTIASDLYSLASTVYALLAGRPAFRMEPGEGQLPFMMRVIESKVPPLPAWPGSDAFDAVLATGMARDPGDRPSSAAELADQLRTALASIPEAPHRAPADAPAGPGAGQGQPTVRPTPDDAQLTAPAVRPDADVIPRRSPPDGQTGHAPWDDTQRAPMSEEPPTELPVDATTEPDLLEPEPATGAGDDEGSSEPRATDAGPVLSLQRKVPRRALAVAAVAVVSLGLGALLLQQDRDPETPSAAAETTSISLRTTSTTAAPTTTTTAPPKLIGTLPVGAYSLAPTGDVLWATGASAGSPMTGIDLATGNVSVSIEDAGADAAGSPTHLWTCCTGPIDGIASRDPTSGEFLKGKAAIIGSLASSEEALWSTGYLSEGDDIWKAVTRLDPASLDVQAIVRLDFDACRDAHATYGGGALWVTCNPGSGERGTVQRIDAATNKVTAVIPVGVRPARAAYGAGSVWVTVFGDDEVLRIDPKTAKIIDRIRVSSAPMAIAVGGDRVWVTQYRAGTVSTIDPNTNEVTATIRVGKEPDVVAFAGGSAWIGNGGDGTLSRVKP